MTNPINITPLRNMVADLEAVWIGVQESLDGAAPLLIIENPVTDHQLRFILDPAGTATPALADFISHTVISDTTQYRRRTIPVLVGRLVNLTEKIHDLSDSLAEILQEFETLTERKKS